MEPGGVWILAAMLCTMGPQAPAESATAAVEILAAVQADTAELTALLPPADAELCQWAVSVDSALPEDRIAGGRLSGARTAVTVKQPGLPEGEHLVFLILMDKNSAPRLIRWSRFQMQASPTAFFFLQQGGVLMGGLIGFLASGLFWFLQEIKRRRNERQDASASFCAAICRIGWEVLSRWDATDRHLAEAEMLQAKSLDVMLGRVNNPAKLMEVVLELMRIVRVWKEGIADEGEKGRLQQLIASVERDL